MRHPLVSGLLIVAALFSLGCEDEDDVARLMVENDYLRSSLAEAWMEKEAAPTPDEQITRYKEKIEELTAEVEGLQHELEIDPAMEKAADEKAACLLRCKKGPNRCNHSCDSASAPLLTSSNMLQFAGELGITASSYKAFKKQNTLTPEQVDKFLAEHGIKEPRRERVVPRIHAKVTSRGAKRLVRAIGLAGATMALYEVYKLLEFEFASDEERIELAIESDRESDAAAEEVRRKALSNILEQMEVRRQKNASSSRRDTALAPTQH